LAAVSFCHFLNDTMQSVVPAVYPLLKSAYHLDFSQIGLIALTSQLTASLLQPLVGLYTDHRPTPWSLPAGMTFTMSGLVLLAYAPVFPAVLMAVALIGVGSAVFHPESSRVARMASGGRHGFAQSLFQVGGNAGSSLGPLLAAFIVIPKGQRSIAFFSAIALLAIVILVRVGAWYKAHVHASAKSHAIRAALPRLPGRRVAAAMAILVALIFSKYFYLASLMSYFTFYLIGKFHITVQSAQIHLFIFLGAVAAGTFIGGPVGDKIGRKYVIWCSILGILPFTLALPYANLFWTDILIVIIGVVLASAFSAILVYAQDLVPGRVGTISGLFFGLAFGMGGVGAALLGRLADATSIDFVYRVCSFLPAIGLLTASATACRQAGYAVEIVSCGGTGSFPYCAMQPGVTDVQVGGAIFSDMHYRDHYHTDFPCALTLMATVTSRPTATRIVLDAGKKAMSGDAAMPLPIGLPGVRNLRLSAEHATIELEAPSEQPRIGDRVEFIVGYSDTTVHLHEEIVGIRRGSVECIWPIAARGRLK
jgi:FSR family fosmidomycin resistance protein-like MFS transporter